MGHGNSSGSTASGVTRIAVTMVMGSHVWEYASNGNYLQ